MRISKITGFFVVIVVAVFYSTGCKDEKTQEGNFSVLAYNVAGLPEGISSSHPQLYTSSISKLINEYSIVHVQEDFCYHDSLLLFNTHVYRTETTGCVPGGDGLNTFSIFPIHHLDRIAWTSCTNADCLTPKGFSFSQIEIEPGTFIDCYNIHCNAGSSTESLAARRDNIVQICNYIQLRSQGNAALVFGDFNSRYTRSGDIIRALLDLGFSDVWVELIRNGEIPETTTSSLNSCSVPRTRPDCERVDKIFYRSNHQIELIPTSYELDDERFYYEGIDTLQLSDHWPLSARFQYRILD